MTTLKHIMKGIMQFLQYTNGSDGLSTTSRDQRMVCTTLQLQFMMLYCYAQVIWKKGRSILMLRTRKQTRRGPTHQSIIIITFTTNTSIHHLHSCINIIFLYSHIENLSLFFIMRVIQSYMALGLHYGEVFVWKIVISP